MTFTYAEGESVVGDMGTYKCPCQQSILGWGVIGGSIPVGVELAVYYFNVGFCPDMLRGRMCGTLAGFGLFID